MFLKIAKLERKKIGVSLGDSYIIDKSCLAFTGCISDALKEDVKLKNLSVF